MATISATTANIPWPDDRIFPLFQTPEQLEVYNAASAPYEIQITLATLVGLINRPQPRIYLLSREHDALWLKEGLSSIKHTMSPLTREAILHDLLAKYRSLVQGIVIYDPALNDTVNIATMIAAQRDGIAVTPAQAQELEKAPYDLALLADLRVYKWSNRLQAYRWAKDNLLSSSSPRLVAGMDPRLALGVRPFLVATRAFIYRLHALNFLPDPKTGGLSERYLMQQILHSYAPNTAGHFGWFIQEGSGVMLTSHAAMPVIASDFYANLEVWSSVRDVQPAIPDPPEDTLTPEANKIYLSFTMSDGDNLQYVQERMLRLWQDPKRGTLPIGWPIPVVLYEAAPAMLDYYVRTATPNDEFIAAPSGVGYMYPGEWPRKYLAPFLSHSGRLMKDMNLRTLEVLESNFKQHVGLAVRALVQGSGMALIDRNLQQRYAEELRPYGVRGILSGGGQKNASWKLFAGVPVYQNLGMAGSVAEALAMIKEGAQGYRGRPIFLNIYILAWNMTPSDLKEVVEKLGEDYRVVTPGKLLEMMTNA